MEDAAPEPLEQWATGKSGARLLFHGTGVAVQTKGVLILGASGSGKSSLALSLMAHGARLIADDGIWLDGLSLTRPDTAAALIEARGVGLLNAGPLEPLARLQLVVDLDRAEPHRLPPVRTAIIADEKVQLILGAEHPNLAPAILHYLAYGKIAP